MTSSRGAMLLALVLVTLARAEVYFYKDNPLEEQYYYKYTDVDTTYKPAMGYNDDDAETLRPQPPTAPASTPRTLDPQELADVKDALKMLIQDREVHELFPTTLTDGDKTADVITSWGTEVEDISAKNALAMVLAQLDALEKTRSKGIPRRSLKASELKHKQDIGVTDLDNIRGWIPVRVKLHRDDTTVEYNGGYDSTDIHTTETTTTTEPDANTGTAFATEYKDIIYELNESLDKIPTTKFSDFKNNGQGRSNTAPKLKLEHVTRTNNLTRSVTASDTTETWVPVDIKVDGDVNGIQNDDYDTADLLKREHVIKTNSPTRSMRASDTTETWVPVDIKVDGDVNKKHSNEYGITEYIATTEPETVVILMYRDMTNEANRTVIEKQTKSLKAITRILNTRMDSLDEHYDIGNEGGGFRRGGGDESGANETSASNVTTSTTTPKSRRRKTKTRKPKRRKTTKTFTYSSTTSKSRRRKTRIRSTSPAHVSSLQTHSSTTQIPLDIPRLIQLITNLTMDYSLNLTNLMNKTLQNMSLFTCPTETTTPMFTTTTTQLSTTSDPYGNLTGTIMGKCFVCGLEEPTMPRHARCADAFSGDFIPLVPVDATARRMLASYRKYCRWMNVPKYIINETDPRSMWGRWTGGCSVRWIDISGIYTQRTCRNRHRAVMGRHWMSKRMAKLEMALQRLDNSCIISPMASLVPLSRGVSLYARFHACVCTGSWCNRASPSPQCILHVSITLLVMFLFIS